MNVASYLAFAHVFGRLLKVPNTKTRASREMTTFFDFNGVNVAKHWHGRGEVFAISDCLVLTVMTTDLSAKTIDPLS